MEEMTREDLIQLVESLQKELKSVKETKDLFYQSSCMYEQKYKVLRDTLGNIYKLIENN